MGVEKDLQKEYVKESITIINTKCQHIGIKYYKVFIRNINSPRLWHKTINIKK